MDHNHPTREELEGLVLGGISAERAPAVVFHLLRGCAACLEVLMPYIPPRLLARHGLEAPWPFPPEAYDAPIDRVFALLNLRAPAVRTQEETKQEALDLLAAGGLESLAEAPEDVSGLALFEALLERSWALRHDDPFQMAQLARAAVFQADHLDASEIGARRAADLRCRAWTELANAFRVVDELDCADRALGHAITCLSQGTQDELLGARFFTVQASQYAARRHFDLACETLDVVAAVYHRHGDGHLAARALIMRGIFTGYSGNSEVAVRAIQQGLLSVDEQRDPLLVFSAMQSQIRFLVDSGRFHHALWNLWSLRQRDLNAGGRMNALKLRWLEGQIHVGLQELDLAESALREVKEGFEEAGLGYKAALAGLELGAVWLRQGNFAGAEEIVRECADVFLSLRIRRETLASLLLVRKAAESRYLSLTALQMVIDLLHKEERSPTASPRDEP